VNNSKIICVGVRFNFFRVSKVVLFVRRSTRAWVNERPDVLSSGPGHLVKPDIGWIEAPNILCTVDEFYLLDARIHH
jgi:hypothetical protein